MLERGDDVGGTWRFNTYPGCACDVPSHLYSFSFAPNPEWTRDLLAPARDPRLPAARRRRVRRARARPPRLRRQRRRLGRGRRRWSVETSDGPLRARGSLIAGMGPLAEPKIPDVPGLDALRGRDVPLRPLGPRLRPAPASGSPSIGTGASAIQFVPEIQQQVAQLHVFQRTAPWVMPHPNRPITRRRARASTGASRRCRSSCAAASTRRRELLVLGFVKHPRLMKLARADRAPAHAQPDLRPRAAARRSRPSYTIGCKRILPSNQWYRALAQAQRRARHRRRREVARNSIVDRRRRGARGRRDHLRHRLPRHRHAGRQDGARAGRHDARRGLARQPARPPGHRRCRASRTCSCCSARTPGSGTARWST